MIPVQPFIADFYCQRCRDVKNHTVLFMSFIADTQVVNFMAICCDCEEEAEDYDEEPVGFTASMPASEWDKITPLDDEIIVN